MCSAWREVDAVELLDVICAFKRARPDCNRQSCCQPVSITTSPKACSFHLCHPSDPFIGRGIQSHQDCLTELDRGRARHHYSLYSLTKELARCHERRGQIRYGQNSSRCCRGHHTFPQHPQTNTAGKARNFSSPRHPMRHRVAHQAANISCRSTALKILLPHHGPKKSCLRLFWLSFIVLHDCSSPLLSSVSSILEAAVSRYSFRPALDCSTRPLPCCVSTSATSIPRQFSPCDWPSVSSLPASC